MLPFAFSASVALAQDPRSQPQSSPAQQSHQDQQVTGKREKSNDGKYLLVEASGTAYQLDDQVSAKRYEGKKVTVRGSLDSSSSTIHVTRIKAAK